MSETPKSAEAFNALAPFYNTYWNVQFNTPILPAVEKLLLARLAQGNAILDVCCGNGYMVQYFYRQGFVSDGLDAANEMLKYAKELEPRANWFCSDARSFRVAKRYHACTVLGYGINHCSLNSKDLSKTFKSLYNALLPDGWLMFDLVMEESINEASLGLIHIQQENHELKSQGEFLPDKKLGSIVVQTTGTPEQRDDQGQKDIHFYQRCFSESVVYNTLSKTGFSSIAFYQAQKDLGLAQDAGPRLFVIAQKK